MKPLPKVTPGPGWGCPAPLCPVPSLAVVEGTAQGHHQDPTPALSVGHVQAQSGQGPSALPSHEAAVWVFISLLPFHLLSPFHVSTFFSLQALRMLMSLMPAPTLALTGC